MTSATALTERAPSRLLQLLEWRALAECVDAFVRLPSLRHAPRGDGHPVLVLPGLIAGDGSTAFLRAFLKGRGYAAEGWRLGLNRGLRPGLDARLRGRLQEVVQRAGRKASLVGWSLGGIYARDLALDCPDAVRSVITLGTPIRGSRRANHAWRIYELASGQRVDDPQLRHFDGAPLPVPTTAIYSRSDGIVAWPCCVEPSGPHAESVEVNGSHCGLGVNATALRVIADRLAQPEGEWHPFRCGKPP